MLVSKARPSGRIVENYIVDFLVKTIIDVRSIGSSFIAYIYDDVDDKYQEVDPYMICDSIASGKDINKILRNISRIYGVDTSVLSALWSRWFYYYGVLTPLLLYPKITDIYITCDSFQVYHVDFGLCNVIIDFGYCYHRHSIKLLSKRHSDRKVFSLSDFVNYLISRISERSGSPITAYMPMISVTDPEFRARFSVSIKPISDAYIHIRLLPKIPWTFGELMSKDSISVDQCALLWYLFDNKVPILIIGPMGSGKTSLANAITFCSNPSSYKAIIMDVDEMFLPGHNIVKLLERRAYGLGVKPITKADLIGHALRIGVDYVIVNEVRYRDEVQAWIDAVTTGHGGVTTFHADNYERLVIRISNMTNTGQDILKEIAIVKMNIRDIINESQGIRIRKRIRKVDSIILPNRIDIPEEEIKFRREIVREFINKTPNQQLSILIEFYKNPDKLLTDMLSIQSSK